MPVSTTDIEAVLVQRGYQVVHETKKKKGFQLDSRLPVYLNKETKTGITALVVHPESRALGWLQKQKDISVSESYFHSSNLGLFPKRNHQGANPIGYGWGITFESLSAVIRCLDQLEGKRESVMPSPSSAPHQIIPEGCDVETVAMRREGHSVFRAQLQRYWGTCAVTGVSHPVLLRASHIKPWTIASPKEKTDPFNGLLLSAHLDVAFDRGLITFNNRGAMILSPQLPLADAEKLGLAREQSLSKIDSRHLPYLAYHRDNVFKT